MIVGLRRAVWRLSILDDDDGDGGVADGLTSELADACLGHAVRGDHRTGDLEDAVAAPACDVVGFDALGAERGAERGAEGHGGGLELGAAVASLGVDHAYACGFSLSDDRVNRGRQRARREDLESERVVQDAGLDVSGLALQGLVDLDEEWQEGFRMLLSSGC